MFYKTMPARLFWRAGIVLWKNKFYREGNKSRRRCSIAPTAAFCKARAQSAAHMPMRLYGAFSPLVCLRTCSVGSARAYAYALVRRGLPARMPTHLFGVVCRTYSNALVRCGQPARMPCAVCLPLVFRGMISSGSAVCPQKGMPPKP